MFVIFILFNIIIITIIVILNTIIIILQEYRKWSMNQ
jgi:hypothetical protein